MIVRSAEVVAGVGSWRIGDQEWDMLPLIKTRKQDFWCGLRHSSLGGILDVATNLACSKTCDLIESFGVDCVTVHLQ